MYPGGPVPLLTNLAEPAIFLFNTPTSDQPYEAGGTPLPLNYFLFVLFNYDPNSLRRHLITSSSPAKPCNLGELTFIVREGIQTGNDVTHIFLHNYLK
jgi:hypothetical protein